MPPKQLTWFNLSFLFKKKNLHQFTQFSTNSNSLDKRKNSPALHPSFMMLQLVGPPKPEPYIPTAPGAPGPWCHLVRTFAKLQKIIHNLQCLAEEKTWKWRDVFLDLKNVDHLVVHENWDWELVLILHFDLDFVFIVILLVVQGKDWEIVASVQDLSVLSKTFPFAFATFWKKYVFRCMWIDQNSTSLASLIEATKASLHKTTRKQTKITTKKLSQLVIVSPATFQKKEKLNKSVISLAISIFF